MLSYIIPPPLPGLRNSPSICLEAVKFSHLGGCQLLADKDQYVDRIICEQLVFPNYLNFKCNNVKTKLPKKNTFTLEINRNLKENRFFLYF